MSEQHYDWQENWYETCFHIFPDDKTPVLGVVEDHGRYYLYIVSYSSDDCGGYWTEVESASYVDVTHWMPLPEKPKEHE